MPYERTDVAVHDFQKGIAPRIVLRRLHPAGSFWELVDESGDWIVVLTVQEAARLAGSRWQDIAQATQIELEYWDPTGTWRGSLDRPHPNPDEIVQGMLRQWPRLHPKSPSRRRRRVLAADRPRALARARKRDDPSIHVLVIGHDAATDHRETVLAVLAETAARSGDAIAIVGLEAGYVQLMDRKNKAALYVEAADLDVHDLGALTEEQREALRALGWSDPKTDLVPYDRPVIPNEWRGGNFARDWRRGGDLTELARVLTQTLSVYGLEETDDLHVDLFPMT
jgi:hypothetical protein